MYLQIVGLIPIFVKRRFSVGNGEKCADGWPKILQIAGTEVLAQVLSNRLTRTGSKPLSELEVNQCNCRSCHKYQGHRSEKIYPTIIGEFTHHLFVITNMQYDGNHNRSC